MNRFSSFPQHIVQVIDQLFTNTKNKICRYGYVTPDDVPALLEKHVVKGEIIDLLWR